MTYNNTVKPFLRKHRISVLSIANSSNAPLAATLHYAWDEESNTFFFFTRTGTDKYQILRQGDAAGALVIGFSEEEFVTVQMRGEAGIHVDDSGKEVYFQKYPNIRDYAQDPNAAFIVFRPTWYRYSDFKVEPVAILTSTDQ